MLIGMIFCNHLRDVPWEHIFKLGVSEAAAEFCKWIQVEIDVYIPHHEYQVNHRSSPWFFAADVAAIAHGNHLIFLNKGKSVIPPLLDGLQVLSSGSYNAKLFTEIFFENCNLDE